MDVCIYNMCPSRNDKKSPCFCSGAVPIVTGVRDLKPKWEPKDDICEHKDPTNHGFWNHPCFASRNQNVGACCLYTVHHIPNTSYVPYMIYYILYAICYMLYTLCGPLGPRINAGAGALAFCPGDVCDALACWGCRGQAWHLALLLKSHVSLVMTLSIVAPIRACAG